MCTVPVPVFVTLATLMHEPRGETHGDAASGLNVADIANVADGPAGMWNLLTTTSWTLPVGFRFLVVQGNCVGAGTNSVTCVFPTIIPAGPLVPEPA